MPSLLLAKRELRQHRVLVAVIAALAVGAAAMLNLSFVLFSQYPSNTSTLADQWNSADAIGAVPSGVPAKHATRMLEEQVGVTGAEATEIAVTPGSFRFGERNLTGLLSFRQLDDPGIIGKHTITTQTSENLVNPIWAPEVLHAAAGYQPGETLTLTTNDGEATFHIQGFFEDSYSGHPGLGHIGFALDADAFSQLIRVFDTQAVADEDALAPGSVRALLVEVTADSVDDALAARDAVTAKVATAADRIVFSWNSDRSTLVKGSTLAAGIMAASLAFSALLVAVIVIVVLRSMCRSAIDADLPRRAILRACGFTSDQATRSLTWTFVGVTTVGGLAGAALSYALIPPLAAGLRAQTGTTWTASFSPVGLAASVGVVVLTALLSTGSAVRALRTMTTVEALHGGEHSHSFRTSVVPLDKAKLPLSVAMGLTSGLQRIKRSAMVTLAVLVASFVLVSNTTSAYTLNHDEDLTMQILAGEIEDLRVAVAAGADIDAAAEEIEALPGVISAYPASDERFQIDSHDVAFIVTDHAEKFRSSPVKQGRYPLHDNEVAIGVGLADALGVWTGDTWTVTLDDHAVTYLITGIASGGRNGGSFAYLTGEGMQQLDPDFAYSIVAINVVDAVSDQARADAAEAIRQALGPDCVAIFDLREVVLVTLTGYTSTARVFTSLISGFTALTALLVLWLTVTTAIREERISLGLRRTLGFTFAQLRAQLMWMVLPPVVVGAAIGGALAWATTGAQMAMMFRPMGIFGLDITVPTWAWAGLPAALTGVAAALVWLLAVQIRQLPTRDLVYSS